jgi:hypothetical protein
VFEAAIPGCFVDITEKSGVHFLHQAPRTSPEVPNRDDSRWAADRNTDCCLTFDSDGSAVDQVEIQATVIIAINERHARTQRLPAGESQSCQISHPFFVRWQSLGRTGGMWIQHCPNPSIHYVC